MNLSLVDNGQPFFIIYNRQQMPLVFVFLEIIYSAVIFMRNFLFMTFFGSLVISFGSCKISPDNKDVVVKVEPEFVLGMYEELDQVRNFNLTFSSIDSQSCSTNLIDYTASRNGKSVLLSINEIVEIENCQTGEGIVVGAASYNFLPIGIYELQLNLKNTISSTGILNVANDRYTLDIEDGFGFLVEAATLMRVPPATVWGYVAYKDNQHLEAANNFLEELNAKTGSLQLSSGDYGYFRVGDNDKLSLNKAPDYNNFKTFYRISSGQISELEELLESFRAQFLDGSMEFKIFTWQGEVL